MHLETTATQPQGKETATESLQGPYPTRLIYHPPPQQAVVPPTPNRLLTFLLAPLGLA